MENYKEYAKIINDNLNTGINTRIADNYRVSSIYRKFSNGYFESWGWETFLWNGDKIEQQYRVLDSADDVVNLHSKINGYYRNYKDFYRED